jgi:simple sugar transport system permease protein
VSTLIDQPPADHGGLAPDPVVTPTRGRGVRKLPIILGVLSAFLAIILLRSSHAGSTTFQLAADTDFVQLPDIVVPSSATAWVMVAVCLALTAEAVRRLLGHLRQPLWIPIAFASAWMVGFLSWAAAGDRIRVVSLLGGAVALAVPLVFGALGGVLGERAGVVNIAIEGQLLFGAFAAAITASLTGSPWAGLVAALHDPGWKLPAERVRATPTDEQHLVLPDDDGDGHAQGLRLHGVRLRTGQEAEAALH